MSSSAGRPRSAQLRLSAAMWTYPLPRRGSCPISDRMGAGPPSRDEPITTAPYQFRLLTSRSNSGGRLGGRQRGRDSRSSTLLGPWPTLESVLLYRLAERNRVLTGRLMKKRSVRASQPQPQGTPLGGQFRHHVVPQAWQKVFSATGRNGEMYYQNVLTRRKDGPVGPINRMKEDYANILFDAKGFALKNLRGSPGFN